jgi:hypothetical protein
MMLTMTHCICDARRNIECERHFNLRTARARIAYGTDGEDDRRFVAEAEAELMQGESPDDSANR